MKKNMWDNVYYRLNDEAEIKLCLLFCIKYADIPISDIEIKHFMLTATSVNFMDLCSSIGEIFTENYAKKVWRDEIEKYDLTEQGKELLEMFEDKIMASVRVSLKDTIDEYFKREKEKSQVKCEIVPLEKNNYCLEIDLQDGSNSLLKMSLFAGSREKAIELRQGFNENPMALYSDIIKKLSEKQE